VAHLVEVERPSTEKVAPLVRESTRIVAKVSAENDELRATVEDASKVNASLGALLTRSIAEGQATKERLLELEMLANEEKRLNDELQIAADKQAASLKTLGLTNFTLEVEVDALTASVAVANQRLNDTKGLLNVANSRIVKLTDAHAAATSNALEWKDAAATAKGKIDTEKTWKWRFFWWAVGATLLVAGYVALRLHPTTRLLIP